MHFDENKSYLKDNFFAKERQKMDYSDNITVIKKKAKFSLHIYKEIQMGPGSKSYMRKTS
jgi:hypothetical protein